MTITEVFDVVDALQDKYGSPYIPPADKVRLFNQAQYRYVNSLIPDNQGGQVNIELDSNTLQNVKSLLFNVDLSTVSGILTNNSIEAALSAQSHAGAKVLRILRFRATNDNVSFYKVRFAKYNNIDEYQQNSLKRPVAPNKMRWLPLASGYNIIPTSDSTTIRATIVKEPRAVSLSPQVDPEWDNYTLSFVLVEMLKLMGVSTRDEELLQDVRIATGQ